MIRWIWINSRSVVNPEHVVFAERTDQFVIIRLLTGITVRAEGEYVAKAWAQLHRDALETSEREALGT